MKRQKPRASAKCTFETVRQLALELPGAVESTSYGTPAFKVAKKLFARLHQDGVSLVIRIEESERTRWMKRDPATFYITDHYQDYPWMLVLLSKVKRTDLQTLVLEAWRQVSSHHAPP